MKLALRILAMLTDTGPRPVMFFRSFAKSEREFEAAIGHLFIKGLVRFVGRKSGRKLVRMT